MQNKVENDPYITENAWKYEVYARLRKLGKRIPDVSEQDITDKANSINNSERQSWRLYARALILSEFYGIPLRMVYDRENFEGVPDDKFRMMKNYGRVDDAYYEYQIQEQGDLTPDGKVKPLEPVKNNEINKIDIDVSSQELEERKKILDILDRKLKSATSEEEKESIKRDISRANKAINDLSSKK